MDVPAALGRRAASLGWSFEDECGMVWRAQVCWREERERRVRMDGHSALMYAVEATGHARERRRSHGEDGPQMCTRMGARVATRETRVPPSRTHRRDAGTGRPLRAYVPMMSAPAASLLVP